MKKIALQDKYQLYINGEWVDASDGSTIETINPATGEKLAEIADATEEDVDKAVKAARAAFPEWAKTTPAERQAILHKIADIIDENREYLATIETMDNGKAIRETSGVDLPWSSDHFRYFAAGIRAHEDVATILDGEFLNLIINEPIGVVGQIVPWNFPFLMAAWKLAPALAAGNTIVFKPSSSTSLSVLEFVKLIEGVLPKGVLNIITGSGSGAGQAIQEHEDIDKLAFTGSTEIGRKVGIKAAERLIPSTLELGGKSANIFFDDMDMEIALDGAQLGILFNQGEVCSAGSRIFVQDTIYDEFVAELVKRFENVKVGDPLNEDTQMGTQVSKNQFEKILNYVKIGTDEGGKVLTGGEAFEEDLAKGFFIKPTLIEGKGDMRIAQEEIFGPVAVVIKFSTEEEVIKMANDSIYGLAGGIFTKNMAKALRVSRAIRTGRMWVNTYNMFPAGSPFGGYKQSGIGRETHLAALDHYTQKKNILINLKEEPSGFFPEK